MLQKICTDRGRSSLVGQVPSTKVLASRACSGLHLRPCLSFSSSLSFNPKRLGETLYSVRYTLCHPFRCALDSRVHCRTRGSGALREASPLLQVVQIIAVLYLTNLVVS